MTVEPLDHLVELGALQQLFQQTVPTVDGGVRVPWCGRWRVRDLVVHLSRVHHWAAAQARRGPTIALGRGPFDLEDLYRDCAEELLTTLAALPPEAPCPTLEGPGTTSFWRRRQVHETAVHLWDLRTAAGLPVEVPARVWRDGVAEVVDVMQPRQVRLHRMAPLERSITLVDSSSADSWVLGGYDGAAQPSTTVVGPADALALLLWGRLAGDSPALSVDGDAGALEAALREPLTP
jgi:uncharacterized protein (TIGR03083 family)